MAKFTEKKKSWVEAAKTLKKYKVVLIKDYVDVISTALREKADLHFYKNKIIKNNVGKKVPIDRVVGEFCLMVKDCVETQYKNQKKRSYKA